MTAHELRNSGQQYISPKTKKLVPSRDTLKPRCCAVTCEKLGRLCSKITEPERQRILNAFYGTASLQLQREYIVRYMRREPKKDTKTKSQVSRRVMSNYYFLPTENGEIKVCLKMFLNTLNISEKTVRTALAKRQVTGIVEKEKRGGRYQILKNKDDEITNAIKAHIQRFPRMESHYCRKSSSREYLHPDLNLTKMFDMFVEEYSSCNITTTYQTYGKVFRSLNLSFHHPK
nr:unnamed protein product [Callosobruchus chinensis]